MNFVIAAKSPPPPPHPPSTLAHTHTHTLHVFNQLTSGPRSRYLAARKLTFVCVPGTLGCHPREAYQDLIVIGNRMEVVIKSGLESRTLGWLA